MDCSQRVLGHASACRDKSRQLPTWRRKLMAVVLKKVEKEPEARQLLGVLQMLADQGDFVDTQSEPSQQRQEIFPWRTRRTFPASVPYAQFDIYANRESTVRDTTKTIPALSDDSQTSAIPCRSHERPLVQLWSRNERPSMPTPHPSQKFKALHSKSTNFH